jgi:threonine/homoserine/homoserine lactone efflux protein
VSKPPEQAVDARNADNFITAYLSTLLLTLTNPLTILSFAAIFAGIGVGSASKSYASASIVVLGVFLGSTLWWCILTSIISLLRRRFTARWLLWINRTSGIIIGVFGVIALISLW